MPNYTTCLFVKGDVCGHKVDWRWWFCLPVSQRWPHLRQLVKLRFGQPAVRESSTADGILWSARLSVAVAIAECLWHVEFGFLKVQVMIKIMNVKTQLIHHHHVIMGGLSLTYAPRFQKKTCQWREGSQCWTREGQFYQHVHGLSLYAYYLALCVPQFW